MLPNFNECWWDSIILDVFCCNWIGKPQCHGVSGSFLHRNSVKWMKSHDDNSVSSAIAILPSSLPPRDLASISIYLVMQEGTNLLQIYQILCLKWTFFFNCRVCDVLFICKVRSCISIASAHTSEHILRLWLDRYLGRNEDSEILWWEDLCMGWSESAEVYIR